MNSRILLKSQRNEIYGLIMNQGFDPVRFVWAETPSELNPNFVISRLIYTDSLFYYAFEMEDEVHVAIFSPAEQSYAGSDYPKTWTQQKASFVRWLHHLKKEAAEPDLWSAPTQNKDKGSYVVTRPSSQSPGIHEMESRLSDLFEPEKNPKINSQRPAIKRYYGKI